MAHPDRKANHSIAGFGFRKMRKRGVTHMDSVHVEYFVDSQSCDPSVKAGDSAFVRKVAPCMQTPVMFFP